MNDADETTWQWFVTVMGTIAFALILASRLLWETLKDIVRRIGGKR
jgi:tellurite resistance protein TehA-like permease